MDCIALTHTHTQTVYHLPETAVMRKCPTWPLFLGIISPGAAIATHFGLRA